MSYASKKVASVRHASLGPKRSSAGLLIEFQPIILTVDIYRRELSTHRRFNK